MITEKQMLIPKWTLVVSGIIAALELMVSFLLCYAPESVADNVDLNAKGVDYLLYMWAARQFALGFIFGYATLKRSVHMLIISYIFLLVMFIGDLVIGIVQNETELIFGGLVMCLGSVVMLFVLHKKRLF